MGFEQVNTFKNIIQDLDYSLRPSDSLELVLNARFITKDGQTYIATNVDGNRNEFKLSDGFVPLGKCEYRGILYIASFNGDTSETEIGCFPSPDFQAGTTTFDRQYRPLYNLLDAGGNRVNMTSDKFNSDKNHQFDMLPRRDYDDSVNLYICDFKNPNFVINTGFDQNGALTERTYTEADFGAEMATVSVSDVLTTINLDRIIAGTDSGLKHGNYILGLRYLDSSLNPTHTITNSAPIPLSGDSASELNPSGNIIDILGVEGGTGEDVTTPTNAKSGKGIKIIISNLSSSYPFVQIVLARYWSVDGGELLSDVNLIDINYPVADVELNGISISGDENLLPYTEAEMVIPQLTETICKTQCHIDNRWWGANWKGFLPDKSALEIVASKIKPRYFTKVLYDDAYKYPENVFNYVGYFRGEVYPLQIVWVFHDGSESEAYRVKGADDFKVRSDSSLSAGDISGGLYRFPGIERENLHDTGSINQLKMLGLKFDFTDALNCAEWNLISSNVKGFYFTRSDRKENLKYQGLALHCIRGSTVPIDTYEDQVSYKDACIPQFDKLPAVEFYREKPTIGNSEERWVYQEYSEGVVVGYLGLYSSDYLFETVTDISEAGNSLVSLGSCVWNDEDLVDETIPANNLHDTEGVTGPPYYNIPIKNVIEIGNTVDIHVENKIGGHWFINKAYDKWTNANRCLFNGDYHHDEFLGKSNWLDRSNRNIKTPKYLGLRVDNSFSENLNKHMINVYVDFDPDSKINIDALEVVYYNNDNCYRICDTVELNTLSLSQPEVECWKGDCFLQRTYIKQSTWFNSLFKNNTAPPYPPNWSEFPVGTNIDSYAGYASSGGGYLQHKGRYAHGKVLGIVSENRMNSAMRHVLVDSNFYPGVISDANIEILGNEWIIYPDDVSPTGGNGSGIEGFILNQGYNKILDSNAKPITNVDLPDTQEVYPHRIRYSDKHIEGSFIDGYKSIAYNNKRDYDAKYGHIHAIKNVLGYLTSVQERTINQHYINEKQVLQDPEAQDIVIGVGDILAEKARKLSTFGSSHQWSIEVGEKTMYGVDFNERILWSVGLTTNEDGKTFMASQNLSKSKLIQRWVYDLIGSYSVDDVSDVTNKFPDNPIGLNKGIVVGYDKRNSDVLYTFLNSEEVSGLLTYESLVLLQIRLTDVSGDLSSKYEAGDYIEFYYDSGGGDYYTSGVVITVEPLYIVVQLTISMVVILDKFPESSDVTMIYNLGKTIAFNEDIDVFTSEYSFTPPMYFNINNDFFSSNILLNDLGTDMYIHDKGAVPSDDNKQTFYGHLYKFVLQWVVNGITGQGNLSSYTKVYDAMQIESDKTDFYKLVYEGQTQVSEHFPFVQPTAFWLDPEYKERRWYVPINRQTDTEEESYDIESQARDTWLKVKLEYFSEVATFVKNIKTFFRVSKS